jgi:hypothetical protein
VSNQGSIGSEQETPSADDRIKREKVILEAPTQPEEESTQLTQMGMNP